MKKQNKLITQISKGIEFHRRKTIKNKTIIESAAKRLLGMSIGRGQLWNMKKCSREMCWVKGYSELDSNPYTKSQLKLLDRNRNNKLKRLEKIVRKNDDRFIYENEGKSRELIFYGKPFSYYYHVIEWPTKSPT